MDIDVIKIIENETTKNRKVALVMVTKVASSTPRGEGSIMAVFENGSTYGTIGGGNFELVASTHAKECIRKGESKEFHYDLTDKGDLNMQCGGKADVFIKVFKPQFKLLIVGAGHIAFQLEKLAKMLGFHVVIFDNREEFCNRDRFPETDELICGDFSENLNNYPIDSNCFVVIVTNGHQYDKDALKAVLKKDTSYIGMIGSNKKNNHIKSVLLEEGISKEALDNVYAPIGIELGGETPEEIAFCIMAEILLIKNGGSLNHFKDKNKSFDNL